MVFVHHTATPNGYAPGDVPAIIRSIYTYHVRSNGWNDIGYNFLIDAFGRIYEGAPVASTAPWSARTRRASTPAASASP